jgi:uncharacterized membrane protein (DUF4010 family)
MIAPPTELDAAVRLGISLLIGAGVGLEREWSGHSTGPQARFAGLRTFVLLGVTGGIAGILLGTSELLAATIVAGSLALTVAAYALASSKHDGEIGGTTEAAALLVTGLGVLAGAGYLALAAGAGALVVLVLREKTRLHWLVRRVSEHELRATLQFAVLALVILPLLPEGPFGGEFGLRPRELWLLVLLFSAINFGAYLIRRTLGPMAGYLATGLAGGLVSSTTVTLEFSRRSRREPEFATPLAFGVIGACTVLVPRVIVVSGLLNVEVAKSLATMLWLPTLIGAGIIAYKWYRQRDVPERTDEQGPRNPLRLGAALQMAVAFQVALSLLALVRNRGACTRRRHCLA